MTQPARLEAILGARVSVDGDHAGHVAGVVVDVSFARVIGLEVRGTRGRTWFLPWIAVWVLDGAVTAESTLALIEVGELDGYTRLGAQIVDDPGPVKSLWVSSDGRIGGEDEVASVSLDALAGSSSG